MTGDKVRQLFVKSSGAEQKIAAVFPGSRVGLADFPLTTSSPG